MSSPPQLPFATTPFTLMREKQYHTLRYLLGLCPSAPSDTPASFHDLPDSSIKDVLFVCIDTEFVSDGRKLCNQELQFGLCVLDTRDVLGLAQTELTSSQWQTDLLKTYNFCVGSSKYCSLVSQKFLFGGSENCRLGDIKLRIAQILPKNRAIVLVTHAGQMDLRFARELEISIEHVCMLDTQRVAQRPLQLEKRIGLKALLNTLQIPFQHIHVAGNDANFTLRALLLLGLRDLEGDGLPVEGGREALVAALRAVAERKRPRSMVERASGRWFKE